MGVQATINNLKYTCKIDIKSIINLLFIFVFDSNRCLSANYPPNWYKCICNWEELTLCCVALEHAQRAQNGSFDPWGIFSRDIAYIMDLSVVCRVSECVAYCVLGLLGNLSFLR